MQKASVKRIIDNKKDKLIEFVLDIEKYPEFVPFCQGSKVYEKKQQGDLTEVTFDVDFEIKNKFLNILMTKSFQFGLEKIADAFQKRAESL